MVQSVYSHLSTLWNTPRDGALRPATQIRLMQWRREQVVVRVERPTRLDRARALGYKAKQGIVVARTRVRRGSLRKKRHDAGRKPKAQGSKKITAGKSIQRIAEERVNKRFRNLEVLNSYQVGADGRHVFFEVILVDPSHPSILADPNLKWVASPANKRRAQRGLTAAGKRGRGQGAHGKGHEKNRPSLRARQNRGK